MLSLVMLSLVMLSVVEAEVEAKAVIEQRPPQ